MSTPRFPARVTEDGALVPVHPERTRRYAGREVWVSIHEKPAFQRSGQSNRLLWAIYNEIAEETGNDPQTVHEALKREAVRVGILEAHYVLMGNQLFEGEPTTVVDQEQHSKYISWIKDGCASGHLVGMRIDLTGFGE
jgi:hypothetical protein